MAISLPCFHRQILIFLILCSSISAVDEDEIESMLILLRSRGHTLFSNAIATSDLIDQILTNNSSSASFTFFAPNENSLFDLDMTDTASDYVSALRCHVMPYRLTFNQLHHFPYGYALRTLLKNRHIHIRSNSTGDDEIAIYIENVRLVAPGIFYSRHLAVHGLGGILSCSGSGRKSRPIHAPIDASESRGETESADFRRSSPANSPAYEPISSTIEAPAPEFPENDYQASFAPERERDEDWIAGVDTEEEEREKAVLRSIPPSDLSSIVGSEPFDEKSFDDCHVTDRIYHAMPRGYCANS